MSKDKKRELSSEIQNTFDRNNPNKTRDFSLGIYTEFERKLPPNHKKANMMQKKTLNTTLLDDCLASQELEKIKTFDCDDPSNRNKNITVTFT